MLIAVNLCNAARITSMKTEVYRLPVFHFSHKPFQDDIEDECRRAIIPAIPGTARSGDMPPRSIVAEAKTALLESDSQEVMSREKLMIPVMHREIQPGERYQISIMTYASFKKK